MKKLLCAIPLFVLFCLAISCKQQGERAAEEGTVAALSAEDIAAIRALGPALDKNALAGDWSAIAAMFTEDVSLMSPNMPSIQGRAAFKTWLESQSLSITEHRIEFHEVGGCGDIAYARATYVETINAVKDEGKILSVLRKQADGSWLISFWISNSDLPAPSSAQTP